MIIGTGFSKLVWGLLLLLAAVFIVANQITGFVELGFWSILVGTLALAYAIASLIKLKFDSLPIPLAIVYIVIQTPLDLPHINAWLLILAAVLASIGLSIILPKKMRSFVNVKKTRKRNNGIKIDEDGIKVGDIEIGEDGIKIGRVEIDEDDADIEIDVDDHVVKDEYNNNPEISMKFGGQSSYLHADSLETVHLECKFGGLEVYFDHAKLSPNGAKVYCDCKFGSIELFVPKEWHVYDDISVVSGGASRKRRKETPAPDAPVLTVKGDVAFGSIEIIYV